MKLLPFIALASITTVMAFSSFSGRANAQEQTTATATQNIPPAVMLTLNKSKIIRLKSDAASVIVSNPSHISVMLDTPRVVVIVARAPGATSFTILDNSGDAILEQEVIVTSREEGYIRLSRSCPPLLKKCVPEELFYCPDGCYRITVPDDKNANTDVPEFEGNSDFMMDDQGEEE